MFKLSTDDHLNHNLTNLLFSRLVCGDVNGQLKSLFKRVESINKKANGAVFEMLFCVGDFFSEECMDLDEYKNGTLKIPIPTYILGPNKNIKSFKSLINEDNNEICENLVYLGKKGQFTVSSGLVIAYLSGIENVDSENTDWTFNKEDVISMKKTNLKCRSNLNDYRGVDLLLTSQWPHGMIENEASKTLKYL